MHNFVIHTDAGCDIRPELLNEWGVTCTNLTLTFEGRKQGIFLHRYRRDRIL